MHKLAKEIMDRVKSKINTCGVDGITEQELIEMKYWTCIADAMTSYDYHYKIIEEMEKQENEYGVNYDERGKYYTPMRRTGRRSYQESYDPNDRNMDMEHYRDMEYQDGKMYYTEPRYMNMTDNRYDSGSRYDMARRGYEESKAMTPDDDSKNMQAMEKLFEVLEGDVKELKPKMSMTEKNFAKTKLNGIANMIV